MISRNLCVCIVCFSYHNKTPQTIWLKQQEFIFSQSGHLTAGCSLVGSGEGHLPACRWLPLFVFFLGVEGVPHKKRSTPIPWLRHQHLPISSHLPKASSPGLFSLEIIISSTHELNGGTSQSSTLYIQEHLEGINRKRSNNICNQNIFTAVTYL